MVQQAHKNGSQDPLMWLIGGALDLLYVGVDKLLGKPVEALIKRLPHR